MCSGQSNPFYRIKPNYSDVLLTMGSKTLHSLRLARISTVSFFIDTQLKSQLAAIIEQGAEVTVIASEAKWKNPVSGCNYRSISITREINVPGDLIALWRLYRLFKIQKFDIVHSTTPKAGFLTAIAGFFAGIPVRMHTFTGQPWVELKGFQKIFMIWIDKTICFLNTCCYADSRSQRCFLLDHNVGNGFNLKVLGNGSLAGVDIERFSQKRFSTNNKMLLKKSLNISDKSFVFIFVGRVVRAKGIGELLQAFVKVHQFYPDSFLLVVGPREEELNNIYDELPNGTLRNIIFVGETRNPEKYMAISDVLCIPSYREGFGTVVIEAAAMQLPAIGSNIYGLSDAIDDGKSGFLIPPKSVFELAEAMINILEDSETRRKMGLYAEARVKKFFSSNKVASYLVREYRSLYYGERNN